MKRYVYARVSKCKECPYFNKDEIVCMNYHFPIKKPDELDENCSLDLTDPIARAQQDMCRKFG